MIRFFAAHPTAANLLMILLFVMGLIALPRLQRETFPDFTVDLVQVSIAYPGASAEQVEEAICQRVEDALDTLTDVEEIRCEAREGVGSATIEMSEGGNVDRFLTDISTEIDAIDDFPEVIERPVIKQIEHTNLVVSIAIAGPMAEPDLKVFAEGVRRRLIRLPEVSQVIVGGFSDRQIRIALDPLAIRQHGLSVDDVARVIERQSIDLPSGLVETVERDVLVRFADERRTPRGFEDLVVIAGDTGAELRLGQIATITDRFERDENRVLLNGQRAALLRIEKTKSQDTLEVMDAVRAFVEAERSRAPPGVELVFTRDLASIVQDRLELLTGNGLLGLLLVLLTLWLFFSFRLSFWVAMGLPASFLGTIFVLVAIGYSINMLTMVALLIAIGLIMDDAIVIAENVARHLREQPEPVKAAIDGTHEVALGVLSSFVTSVCVFTPLAFMDGNLGKVLQVVPVVLIVTLAVSLVEAFLVLPHHLAHGVGNARPGRFRLWFDGRLEYVRSHVLGWLVDRAIAWRYLTFGIVVMIFLIAIGAVIGGTVKFRAFPDLDGDVIEARILLPQGTPLARTEAVVADVVNALERVDATFAPRQIVDEPFVRNVLIQYGTNVAAFESGPHVASVTVDLLQAERRKARLTEVLNAWRSEVGILPDVLSMTFAELQTGPAGIPIDIRLQGDDLAELKQASEALTAWLARYRGVTDLQDDLRPGKPEIRLKLREGAMSLGLDAAALASQLRSAFQGRIADEIQVGSESFEIDVRIGEGGRDGLGDLDAFAVTLPGGGQAPLPAVAIVEEGRGVARIARIDGLRTVTLRGDVDTAVANINEVLADTQERFLPKLKEAYPGVSVVLKGQAEEQRKTGGSMQRGFLIGLLGIFILLSFQFRSYFEPIIVMLAIPFALIGVIAGHALLGLDLSMPSALGAAALAGIVVNDSILLVMFVKRNAARGEAPLEAARHAARQRFRAVLLTSLTTIAGLLPLLFERSLQAQVLIPLVTSLVFGLLASTFLVLIMVPATYAILTDMGLTTVARDAAERAEPDTGSGVSQPAE